MKRLSLYTLMLSVLAMIATSCIEDKNVVWEGLEVEFDAASRGGSSGIYLRENDGVNKPDNVQINLVGAAQSQPVNVNFEIDASSTAIAGVHYNMVTSGNTVTVGAGEFMAQIDFEVIADNIEAGEKWTLVFNLTSSDAVISENFSSVTHTMEISCPSDLAGSYATLSSGTIGGGNGDYSDIASTVTLTAQDDGITYDHSDISAGMYVQVWGGVEEPTTLSDVCDALTIPDTADQWGDTVSSTVSNYDKGAGTFTVTWSNTYGDSGVSAYTKQ